MFIEDSILIARVQVVLTSDKMKITETIKREEVEALVLEDLLYGLAEELS